MTRTPCRLLCRALLEQDPPVLQKAKDRCRSCGPLPSPCVTLHLHLLQVLSGNSGGSLGYGFATKTADDDPDTDSEDDMVGVQPAAVAA